VGSLTSLYSCLASL